MDTKTLLSPSTSTSLPSFVRQVKDSSDVEDDSPEEKIPVPVALIGADNYLTLTEGKPSALTKEELTEAVTKCKELIVNSAVLSDERKWLVRRLIELRYQLLNIDEVKEDHANVTGACWPIETSTETTKSRVVLGHHLKIRYEPTSTTKRYCDTCCCAVWNVIQSWYQCTDCRYRCHTKCVEQIARPCAHLVASENPEYESRICPEIGLAAQNYLCAECKVVISFSTLIFQRRMHFQQLVVLPSSGLVQIKNNNKNIQLNKTVPTMAAQQAAKNALDVEILRAMIALLLCHVENSWLAPRLCDYSGLYYCTSCHWNNSLVIPARISLNWDFKPYTVSRAAYQLLRFTRHRLLITLETPLYGFVKELAEVNRLREELCLMKPYLVRCREAKAERKLLWQLFGTRAHLTEPSARFSLQDMMDLNSGKLLEQMRHMADKFIDHITKNCVICSGQGFRCELCDDKESVFFPFYSSVYNCPHCSWACHKTCWINSPACRRCERNNRRKQEAAERKESQDCGPSTSGVLKIAGTF